MLNITVKNNSILENKKSKTLLYTIATLATLNIFSGSALGSKSVYACKHKTARLLYMPAAVNQTRGIINFKKGKCLNKEDQCLKYFVNQYGTNNWRIIVDLMHVKSVRQIRERHQYYLNPGISTEPWTPEEDQLLKEKYEELGNKWTILANFFPGRTDTNIKNRWQYLEKPERQLSKQPKQILPQIAPVTKCNQIFNNQDYDDFINTIQAINAL